MHHHENELSGSLRHVKVKAQFLISFHGRYLREFCYIHSGLSWVSNLLTNIYKKDRLIECRDFK